jgi:hypothetical protein
MMYLVTAAASHTFQFEAAVDAIAKAKELSDLGKQDVTILAPDGKAYQSGEFPLLLKGAEENDYPPEGTN